MMNFCLRLTMSHGLILGCGSEPLGYFYKLSGNECMSAEFVARMMEEGVFAAIDGQYPIDLNREN